MKLAISDHNDGKVTPQGFRVQNSYIELDRCIKCQHGIDNLTMIKSEPPNRYIYHLQNHRPKHY